MKPQPEAVYRWIAEDWTGEGPWTPRVGTGDATPVNATRIEPVVCNGTSDFIRFHCDADAQEGGDE